MSPIISMLGWVISPILSLIVGVLAGKLSLMIKSEKEREVKRDEEHEALMSGMRELLKGQLYDMHRRYVVNKEPMSYAEKERADSVYNAYHGVYGNGTGTHIYEEIANAYVGERG